MIECTGDDRDQLVLSGKEAQPVAHTRQGARGTQFVTAVAAGKFHSNLSAALRLSGVAENQARAEYVMHCLRSQEASV